VRAHKQLQATQQCASISALGAVAMWQAVQLQLQCFMVCLSATVLQAQYSCSSAAAVSQLWGYSGFVSDNKSNST
jgi:hypothetical protein